MKKILMLITFITINVFASQSCSDLKLEGFLRDRVHDYSNGNFKDDKGSYGVPEYFINKRLAGLEGSEAIELSAAFAGKQEGLAEAMNKCGLSSSMELQINAQKINMDVKNLNMNLGAYIDYLYKTYSSEDRMLSKYYVFVTRPGKSEFINFKIKKSLPVFEQYNDDYMTLSTIFSIADGDMNYITKDFNPSRIIFRSNCFSNFSDVKNIGHLDINFQNFLVAIYETDFEKADQILIKTFKNIDVDKSIENGCNLYHRLQQK